MRSSTIQIAVLVWYLDFVFTGLILVSNTVSWDRAQFECEEKGMRLACLKNETLYQTARDYIQSTVNSVHSEVWIGLRTTSTSPPHVYYWIDGDIATYFNWRDTEPNYQNVDQCIKLYKDTLEFGTSHCNLTRSYLCEDVPVNGEWSIWTAWSECSATCGNGTQSRNRSCDSPHPSHGGKECEGMDYELQICNVRYCPVHGLWSAWREWSDCGSVQCGVPNRTRSRSCDSPPPMYGGSDCAGEDQEIGECESLTCPATARWLCKQYIENSVNSSSLHEKLQEITRTLMVNKTSLSSEVRKKTCAEDHRPSSKYMGAMAGAFIGIYLGILLLIDCSSLSRWACSKNK